ncbi:1,4-alpha-glucan branching protein GlgB [Paenibacillus sp. FJAT-26967]|uniref:1,4-alpha-glucan branching protein GlgB n=1 Tax=Paenibacillus sp. FJAT-26967 TaxID=1729690 RepID=UPI000839686E|nr:1,4-alpha-glucan branching protein GlgB [Paenibacillus sp. FJAT-26967]
MAGKQIPGSEDIYLFHEGTHYYSYRLFGAHVEKKGKSKVVRFTVWAPHAREVRVVGDFNEWNGEAHLMQALPDSGGIWSLEIPDLDEGVLYKYEIHTADGRVVLKADPYAFYSELRPGTASRIYNLDGYKWGDGNWRRQRGRKRSYDQPMSIYEVHLGTWKKRSREEDELFTYRELADDLVDYVVQMGYTHIELMPISEHPFDRSWGYQSTGYFAATSRFGEPKDFMYFVDRCHQRGIGVILDWVPGHFCKDAQGLRQFDGQPLYEPDDPKLAEKPEWGTLAFDFDKPEVHSFLISNVMFWMEQFHIDGIRVDAVASMLSLNFGKPEHQWTRNAQGGEENLSAIEFLKKLNTAVFGYYPHALMMAEDSTNWPMVTSPVDQGGLGFNYKWNMGWMNDMLKYMKLDPVHRKHHHNLITFSFMYAFNENYVLPLSHDEVVHGKRSILHKMPGDYWQKFANTRVLYGYMTGHPGKKLLFMGGEFGQFDEWKDLEDLDWFLLDYEMHGKMHTYNQALNTFYLQEPALWQADHEMEGFQWISPDDNEQSVVAFIRKGKKQKDDLIVVCNFTPVVHPDYRIGIPKAGVYAEVFNSDDPAYGGSGQGNSEPMISEDIPMHGFENSLSLRVPPLAAVYLKRTKLQPASPVKSGRKGKSKNA